MPGRKGVVVIPAIRNPRTGKITKRNIAAGFYDEDGIFHPIRASFDYDRSRAGDKPKKRAKPKRRAKRR